MQISFTHLVVVKLPCIRPSRCMRLTPCVHHVHALISAAVNRKTPMPGIRECAKPRRPKTEDKQSPRNENRNVYSFTCPRPTHPPPSASTAPSPPATPPPQSK